MHLWCHVACIDVSASHGQVSPCCTAAGAATLPLLLPLTPYRVQDALTAEIHATMDMEAAGALLGLQSPSSTPLMSSPAPDTDAEVVTSDLAAQMLQMAAAAATAATATAAAAGIAPAELAEAC